MSTPTSSGPGAGIPISSQSVQVSQIASIHTQNTLSVTWFAVTPERVELALLHHQNRLRDRYEWTTPAGLLLAIVLALVTADFHHWVFPGPVWEGTFLVSGLVTGIWLIRTLLRLRAVGKRDSISMVLEELRKP
jgi:hypothetical protein